MQILFSLGLILGFANHASAESGLEAAMPVYYHWISRAVDDPKSAIKEVDGRLKELDPDRHANEWIQLKLFMFNYSSTGVITDYAMLQDFAARARKAGREDAALFAEYTENDNKITLEKNEDEALYRENYLGVIAKAKEAHVPWIAVMLLTSMTFWEHTLGRLDLALIHGREALELVKLYEPTPGLDTLKIKNVLAILMEATQENAAAEVIYREILGSLKDIRARDSKANILYNLGHLLAGDKARIKETEKIMREALEIAQSLGDPTLISVCQRGLASALSQLGHYELSNQLLDEGIPALKGNADQMVMLANMHLTKAHNFIQLKAWKDALREIGSAKISTVLKDKSFGANLEELEGEALAGLGRMEDAYRLQKHAASQQKEVQREEKAADMNKLKVSMGLQLQEQRNEILNQELHQAALKTRIFYMALGVALVIIGLLLFASWESRRVKRGQLRIQRIRDHMEDGIFSIGSDFQTEADLSPSIADMLGGVRKDERRWFDRLIQATMLSQDERDIIRASVQACLGEGPLAWDLNQDQFPLEFQLQSQGQWLSCDWRPIYDEKQIMTSVLLVVRDVTSRKKLQESYEAAQAIAHRFDSRLQEILRVDGPSALSYLQELQSMLPPINQAFQNEDGLQSAFRALHTLKGGARALGFKELATAIHGCEDMIDIQNMKIKDKEKSEEIIRALNESSDNYQRLLNKLAPMHLESPSQPENHSLHQMFVHLLPSVKQNLARAHQPLESVEIRDSVVHWSQRMVSRFQKILTHALNNSLDHGFILPRQRGEKVPDAVKLKISAEVSEGRRLKLCVRDNGVGLDAVKLTRLASERGFLVSSPEDLPDVLLLDGVSTAGGVTETSGRGVGLAAVQELCHEAHGWVKIRPNDEGQGAMLIAELPQD